MAFFHRRSRGKDDAEGEPARAEPKENPSVPAGRDAPPAPSASTPPPSTSPPPLPQRSPGPSPSAPGAEKFTTCFVCGSALDAGACPKCKVTWVE